MPELLITYRKKRTLNALRDFAKYLDYKISENIKIDTSSKVEYLKGIPIIQAKQNADAKKLKGAFNGRKITLADLRKRVWRKK